MQLRQNDWFHNNFSNNDLRDILSDLHYEKFGTPYWINDAGRCVLARELEAFGPFHDINPS